MVGPCSVGAFANLYCESSLNENRETAVGTDPWWSLYRLGEFERGDEPIDFHPASIQEIGVPTRLVESELAAKGNRKDLKGRFAAAERSRGRH